MLQCRLSQGSLDDLSSPQHHQHPRPISCLSLLPEEIRSWLPKYELLALTTMSCDTRHATRERHGMWLRSCHATVFYQKAGFRRVFYAKMASQVSSRRNSSTQRTQTPSRSSRGSHPSLFATITYAQSFEAAVCDCVQYHETMGNANAGLCATILLVYAINSP